MHWIESIKFWPHSTTNDRRISIVAITIIVYIIHVIKASSPLLPKQTYKKQILFVIVITVYTYT